MLCAMNKIFSSTILAFKALLLQKSRSILTILAISIGISAVIVVFAAGRGLDGLIKGQLDTFGTGIIELETKVPNVGKTSSENGQGQALGIVITTFKNKDLEAIKKHQNITHIYGAVMGQEVVTYQDVEKKVFLQGVSYEAPEVDSTQIDQGRFFTKDEEESLQQVVVLGYSVWQKFFGDEDPVGKSISIKGNKYKVVGVAAERGSAFFMNLDDNLYLPLKTMQKRVLGIDYISFAVAKMKDSSLSKQTQEDLTFIMREEHNITDPNKDDFAVNTMDEAQSMLGNIVGTVTILLVTLVCISLVVGGIGIMNIMYVSVAERTFEIGLRKAVGAKRKDILWQFLTEAVIVTLSGGVTGIVLGAILAYLIMLVAVAYGFAWTYSISLMSIVVAVGFSVVIGLIFGIYPAKKAANLDPIVALRKD
ncbi:MAG: Macrolide export ATP-binding/permease protein MacB [Candidatus Magasanikbacteria bacterium GW2011_GWC2_37_14]|uniref:Macrolide export ATP-binding/permease protein MacB n=1 Tax=Candidatus Magasanikbacteria bacterium GW2011_GWC2_37_14 TaxID=1619046 RepID=A0A0G0GAU7_9BACT|nr:MAG: Macrolide export ATP-binding/permease protein MacB [Candidatus Magasanikbacteria bacterium GW2011_GWC2_37_14]